MSWCRRSVLLGLVALPACGFSPVYGPGGAANGLTGRISVDPPRDETGFVLVQRLEERLGRGGDTYRLAADLDVDEERQGITASNDSIRIHLVGTLNYQLIQIATGQVLRRGEITSFTGYSAPVFTARRASIAGNPVTVRAARRDATERLMTILADRLTSELLATASDWR